MAFSNVLLLLLTIVAFNPGSASTILTTNTLLILLLFLIAASFNDNDNDNDRNRCCQNNFPFSQRAFRNNRVFI